MKLAFYDFLRHWKRNLFLGFLMAVLCLLITCFYSIFSYQYGRYEPFEMLETNQGFFVRKSGTEVSEIKAFEEGLANLIGIENRYSIYMGGVANDAGISNVYAYEKWIWDYWEPRLKVGRWFEEGDLSSKKVPVIVGGDTAGYEVGQTFTCSANSGGFRCEIIGILQEGTEILWGTRYNSLEMHYDTLFNVEGTETTYMLMPYELAEKHGVDLMATEWMFLKYDDNLSEEDRTELHRQLGLLVDANGYSHETFLKLSREALVSKMLVYFPMMVAGIILVIFLLFTVAFINVEKGGKYYRIYYLNGCTKRKCYAISCGNIAGTVLVSGILYILLSMVADIYCRSNNITFNISAGGRILAVLLYGVFAFFMLLCMYIAMRKNSPLEMLRKRK